MNKSLTNNRIDGSAASMLAAFLVSTVLSGCASTSVPANQAQHVPVTQRFLPCEQSAAHNATVTFVRDKGFVGSGVFLHLSINGQKAASINPGERVDWFLKPGEYAFGVVPTDPLGTHALSALDQDLKADRRYEYRILTDGDSMRSSIVRVISP